MFLRRYDDGDVDKNLKAKHVKALDAGSDSDGSARKKRRDRSRSRSRSRSPKRGRTKLREGDKCQAHFRGKSSAKLFESSALRVSCSPSYAMSQVPGQGRQDPLRRYCGREVVTAWKSRLAHAVDAFPGLPRSVADVRTGMRTATATRGSRRST